MIHSTHWQLRFAWPGPGRGLNDWLGFRGSESDSVCAESLITAGVGSGPAAAGTNDDRAVTRRHGHESQ